MKVTLYSTATCSFCRLEEQWLQAHGIEYTKKLIDSDMEARKELPDDVRGVPYTLVEDGESSVGIRGFNQQELSRLLLK